MTYEMDKHWMRVKIWGVYNLEKDDDQKMHVFHPFLRCDQHLCSSSFNQRAVGNIAIPRTISRVHLQMQNYPDDKYTHQHERDDKGI
jgi:hypothetical protein